MSNTTQATHTPGPWHVFGGTAVYGPGFGENGILEQYIAEACFDESAYIEHPLLGPVRAQIDKAEAEANARLIAAAPDLLAALEALMDADFRQPARTMPLFQAARDAIARARGAQ